MAVDFVRKMVGLCLLVPACGGCMVGPDYKPPTPPTPDAWHVDLIDGLDAEPRGVSAWWKAFDDAQLDELIAMAQRRNYDLRIAASRIQEARAKHGIAAADLWPGFTAGGLVHWQHLADRTIVSDILPNNEYIAKLDMSWEIDLFGRVRRSMESAEADVQGSIEDWRDVLVTIRAEVANSYIAVRTLQLEAATLRQSIRLHRETFDLVTQKYDAGTATDVELARAQASLNEVESRLPAIETGIARAINRISVLIGEAPGPLRRRLGEPGKLPAPPGDIAVGIPADVIRRRPDIRAAERRLASKTARIGVAVANLYPQLRINGAIGFESASFSSWFNGDNWSGGIGPTLVWPIFSGGRILNDIKVTDLQTQQALFAYEQTVLRAFEEAENALIAYTNSIATQRELGETVLAYEQVVELASQRYAAGVEDLQSLLTSQRLLLETQEQLSKADGEVVGNVVSLYKALGGDWELPPGPAPQRDDTEGLHYKKHHADSHDESPDARMGLHAGSPSTSTEQGRP